MIQTRQSSCSWLHTKCLKRARGRWTEVSATKCWRIEKSGNSEKSVLSWKKIAATNLFNFYSSCVKSITVVFDSCHPRPNCRCCYWWGSFCRKILLWIRHEELCPPPLHASGDVALRGGGSTNQLGTIVWSWSEQFWLSGESTGTDCRLRTFPPVLSAHPISSTAPVKRSYHQFTTHN